jgi:hypothetical protein
MNIVGVGKLIAPYLLALTKTVRNVIRYVRVLKEWQYSKRKRDVEATHLAKSRDPHSARLPLVWFLSDSLHSQQFNLFIKVGFEVLTAVSMKMAVFWVLAPCSLVEVY